MNVGTAAQPWETSAVKQKKAKSAKTGKKVMKKRRSAFLDGLESGQSYQVRVRLYVKSKSKRYYGKWSAVQTVSVG